MNAKSIITTLSIAAIAAALVLLLLQQKKPEQASKEESSSPSATVEIQVELNTIKQKASYALGVQIANNLKQQIPDNDVNAIALAVKDVLGGEPRLDKKEMRDAMQAFQKQKIQQRKEQGEKNKAEGVAFLVENKKKEGIIATKSGLQYKVLKKSGGDKPKATDTVVVNYKGTLINGDEFDSSYSRGTPATFALNRVIKGWGEGMQLMNVGSKVQFFIPPDLAYGERGAGAKIPPNTTLVFEVELMEIKKVGAVPVPGARTHPPRPMVKTPTKKVIKKAVAKKPAEVKKTDKK